MDLLIALVVYALWKTRYSWLPVGRDPHWARLELHSWPEDHFTLGHASDRSNGKHYMLKSYSIDQEQELQNNFEAMGQASGLWPVRSLHYKGQSFLLFEQHPGTSLHSLIKDLRAHQANVALDLAFRMMIEVTRKWATMEHTPFWGRGLAPQMVTFGPVGTYFNCWGWPLSSATLNHIDHHCIAHYLPPELRTGGTHPASSADIFSIGAIFYELLVLAPWHQGQATLSLLEGKVVTPSSVRHGLSTRIDHFILKCLSYDPGDRFENYHAFAQFLENLADREAPAWRDVSWDELVAQFGPQFWSQWSKPVATSEEEETFKKAA